MIRSPSPEPAPPLPACAIERALSVLGDRWTLLLLREALIHGVARFSEFEDRLGIAPATLADRLDRLVRGGVLERVDYRDPGRRARPAYRPTAAGRDLLPVLGALHLWGDTHVPRPDGPSTASRERSTLDSVQVGFVRTGQTLVPPHDVEFFRLPHSAD